MAGGEISAQGDGENTGPVDTDSVREELLQARVHLRERAFEDQANGRFLSLGSTSIAAALSSVKPAVGVFCPATNPMN